MSASMTYEIPKKRGKPKAIRSTPGSAACATPLDEVIQEYGRTLDLLRHENRELRAQLSQRPSDTPNKLEDEVPPHY